MDKASKSQTLQTLSNQKQLVIYTMQNVLIFRSI